MWRIRGDAWAVFFLALGVAVLFRLHLVGLGTFIGDSDRLNSFLNIRTFEVRTLQHHGALAWNEDEFMGFDAYGLPWISTAVDPLAHLEALLPITWLLRVAGLVACMLVFLTAWSAYLFIKNACGLVFPALVGAGLYALSFAAVLRISQNDATFGTLTLIPLGLVALRRLRPGTTSWSFLGLTAVMTVLLEFTFLQEAVYACLFLGAYAVYLSLKERNWGPQIAFAGSLIVSSTLATPRLITILEDLRLLARTSTFFRTHWSELFRWFNDGVFGRFPGEAHAAHNFLNLHEGLQLYASTFATILVLIGALRVRGRVGAWSVIMFFVVLSWVPSPRIGLGGSAAVAAALIGLYVVTGKAGGPFVVGDSSVHAAADVPFHLFLVTSVLAVVLIEPVHYLFYLAFLKKDLTHSRLSIIALLPECVLVGVFLRDALGVPKTPEKLWSTGVRLSIAVAAAAVTVWLVNTLATSSLTARFGLTQSRLGGSLLPAEVMRVVWAGVIFIALCSGLYAARHMWPIRQTLTYWLGFAMLFQAWTYADFQLSGPQTWTFPVPFAENDFLNVPSTALRPPADRAVAGLRRKLETDRYRTVLVADPNAFPAFVAPHVSQFWGIRLIEGYAAGIPKRLSHLPWPDGVLSLRALSFPDAAHLPWPLLSVLNVKYAVVVNPALYYNLGGGRIQDGSRMSIRDLVLIQNPLPVVPREFFTEVLRPIIPATAPAPSQPRSPQPPSALTATVDSDNEIQLSWIRVTPNAVYRIERKEGPGVAFQEIGMTGANGASYDDTGLKPHTLYVFRIRACTVPRCSPYSAEISATTANGTLSPPTELKATAISSDSVRLEWTAPRVATAYRIERRGPAGAYVEVGVTSSVTRSYVVRGLKSLSPYSFRVRACAFGGCSPHSAEARAFTPSALMEEELRGKLPADPTKMSFAEGVPAPIRFRAAGSVQAEYRGDTIDIRVDQSDQPRFLVLNELYHPAWRAFAGGRELRIYPTNIVMRGLEVPPGITEIRLKFVPYFLTLGAGLFAGAGLFLLCAAWWVSRYVDRAAARSSPIDEGNEDQIRS